MMTLNVSYPGVYLSETGTSTISIQNGQTIVPLFIYRKTTYPSKTYIYKLNNSEDLFNINGNHTGFNYYRSASAWFQSGGGTCYLALIDDIETAVQKYDEINLIVSAGFAGNGVGEKLGSQSKVIAVVNNLTASGKSMFALLDGPENKINANDSLATIIPDLSATPHAAVFYPWCHSDSIPTIPPSVVAALAIAKTDSTRGAWKAPCNVPVSGITPNYPVTDELQG
ncbi:hypothetical protein VU661_25050, partial [Enterobacter kobei]